MSENGAQLALLPAFPPSLEDILLAMHENKASDAFISAGAPVKLKLNGYQQAVTKERLTNDDIDVLLSSLNSDQLSALDTAHELNCVVSLTGVGRFRLSAFCQRNSKAFVVRYIPYDIPNVDSLGLPQKLKELALMKKGLILVVGPTGSGKTTTLASMVNHRNETCSDHIITVEDPIEFLFKHKNSIVNQREIGTDAASFSEALKNAMRQSPDVILVGEIRDKDTMSLAMHYAQSGHLCLATLHADNTHQAITRMVSFYEPSHRDALYQELAGSLQAIVAQRLIPSTSNTRIAAVEVLVTSSLVQELISNGEIRKIPESMERSLASGTTTFENQLLDLVREHKISVENALLYSDSPSNLYWRLAKENLHIDSRAATIAGVSEEYIKRYETANEGKKDMNSNSSASFSSISIDPNRL
jgi:twitching motility protein PilU